MKLTHRPELLPAVGFFRAACALSRIYDRTLADALALHGDHGPHISGIGRDHFPEWDKAMLRELAHRISWYSERGHQSRPPRVQQSTMRKLAQTIALQDGGGFYGPRAS